MLKLLDQNKIDMQFLRDLWAPKALEKIYNIYQYLIRIRLCSVLAKCWKWSEMAKKKKKKKHIFAHFCLFY